MAIKKFRKMPVCIEAFQLTPEIFDEHPNVDVFSTPNREIVYDPLTRTATIDTLEGLMTAKIGDWIIKGIKGEFYPCKPDVFAATYEEVK